MPAWRGANIDPAVDFERAGCRTSAESEVKCYVLYERGPVRIHYEEYGKGFPLLLIAGGLNRRRRLGNPLPPSTSLREFRCIASDLCNANTGQFSGPLEIDRP